MWGSPEGRLATRHAAVLHCSALKSGMGGCIFKEMQDLLEPNRPGGPNARLRKVRQGRVETIDCEASRSDPRVWRVCLAVTGQHRRR